MVSKKLTGLIIFGIAFGFVEAVVVYYLRQLLGISTAYSQPNTLFAGAEVVGKVEVAREAATILMLVGVALASSSTWKQKIGAFFITFSLWDLFYYIFLKVLSGWPIGLFSQDVYFLIPIPWIGPVVIFSILLIVGIGLYTQKTKV